MSGPVVGPGPIRAGERHVVVRLGRLLPWGAVGAVGTVGAPDDEETITGEGHGPAVHEAVACAFDEDAVDGAGSVAGGAPLFGGCRSLRVEPMNHGSGFTPASPAPEPIGGPTPVPGQAALARIFVFAGVDRRIIAPGSTGGLPCELVVDAAWISLTSDRSLRTRWFDVRRDEEHEVMLVGRRAGIAQHLRLRNASGFAEVTIPPGSARHTIADTLTAFGWTFERMWS